MIAMLRVFTSESMIPRPCFQILQSPFIYCSATCSITASLLPAILLPSTARQQAIFWCRYYRSYSFIPLVFHYLFAELVHLYIYKCIRCVGDTRDFLYRDCRVAWEGYWRGHYPSGNQCCSTLYGPAGSPWRYPMARWATRTVRRKITWSTRHGRSRTKKV